MIGEDLDGLVSRNEPSRQEPPAPCKGAIGELGTVPEAQAFMDQPLDLFPEL